MKNVIIGTAGHVDHGKTTLIQALTGTNTDRLKEEQERGMTIDIGFAALRLPDGNVAGIVDVPGHERFVKNMLAGASGIDVALLVIAADEGVMPQTREHLQILRLLDVRNGIVALTKIDLVDKEWTDAVEEDVRLHLKDTFLESSPFIRVSAATGKGIDALKRALLSASSRAAGRNASLPFRLPIDRVFTRPGFGTVVTGTLVAGSIRAGDQVEIVPQGITTRVRGIQVHGQKQKEALAGARVAVNLPGVEVSDIERGAQLAPPGALIPTTTFDAVVQMLPDAAKALQNRSRIRLHIGTLEILGRVRLLDTRAALDAGGRAFIQFRGETEFACARGDRFVMRTYSPAVTIGGGAVLDAHPKRHRAGDAAVLGSLASREAGSSDDILETSLQGYPTGILRSALIDSSGIAETTAREVLDGLIEQKRAIPLPGNRLIHPSQLRAATDRALSAVEKYHAQFPLRRGMPKEELRGILGKSFDSRTFQTLSSFWHSQNQFVVEGATINLPDFTVELNERQHSLLTRIEDYYKSKGIASPTIEEVTRWVKAPPDAIEAILHVGVEKGKFARVQDGIYYHADTLKELQTILTTYLAAHPTITVATFRDLTQSNRKFALLFLEYQDQLRFTRRDGDERSLFSAVQSS